VLAQQGWNDYLQRYAERVFPSTIECIQSYENKDSKSNWRINWSVAKLSKGAAGATNPDYEKGIINIIIDPTSLRNGFLALIVGHELVHGLDIANGNHLQWLFEFGPDGEGTPTNAIMEVHAWEWTQKYEQHPSINMPLGDGAAQMLPIYRSMLPANFPGFNHYNR